MYQICLKRIDVLRTDCSGGFCAFAILICAACSCSERGDATSVMPVNTRDADTRTSAWVAVTDDGREVEVKPLEPLHMQPPSEHEYFVDEDPGAGFCVDPQTGEVAWRALVCRNPDCSGRQDGKPHVFAHSATKAPLTADGGIDHLAWDRMASAHASSVVCPACGQKKGIAEYDPPDVAVRRQLLLDQLAAARAERRRARRSSKPLSTSVRSPADIMRDLSALPKLFLAEP